MRMLALASLILAAAAAAAAVAPNQAIMGRGAVIYEKNCALCHMENGAGHPPSVPALAGNKKLSDIALIVSNMREGQGNMPAVADLDAPQIAAVGTYVRNCSPSGPVRQIQCSD